MRIFIQIFTETCLNQHFTGHDPLFFPTEKQSEIIAVIFLSEF